MHAPHKLRAEVVRYSQAMHRSGWVANHDGNITVRLTADRFLATPTATSKADVTEANLLETDGSGNRVAGTSKRFSEINLHLAVYQARADVIAVVHAHPPFATAIACSGANLIEKPFIAEAVVSLGPEIPLVPFAMPGPDAVAALAPFIGRVDAVLLANHGVLAWGQNVEQAFLRLELVEHLARIATHAQAAGGVRPISSDRLAPLLAARAGAGLGTAADAATRLYGAKSVIACAPAPHASVNVVTPTASSEVPANSSDLARIIREELMRSLGGE